MKEKLFLFDKKSLVGILISIVCFYFFIKKINFIQLLNHLKMIQISYFILAMVIIYFSVWLRAVRWKYLFKDKNKVTVTALYENQMIGYLFNNIFPIRAGEFIRSFLLAKKYNFQTTFVFGTVILERFLDTLHIVFLTFLLLATGYLNEEIINSIALVTPSFIKEIPNNLFAFLFIVTAFFFILFILFRIILSHFSIGNKIKNAINNLFSGLSSINKEDILKVIFFGSLIWFIYWIDVYLIQYAFNLDLNLFQSLLILILCTLIAAIPASPGALGTFHLAVQYIMVDLLGFDYDISAAFAIVLHFYGYFTYNVFGFFHLIQGGYYKEVFQNNN